MAIKIIMESADELLLEIAITIKQCDFLSEERKKTNDTRSQFGDVSSRAQTMFDEVFCSA